MASRNRISQEERARIFAITDGRCFYCGCKLDPKTFEADHFIPFSKGGKKLVPSCQDCNVCKSDMSLPEFANNLADRFDRLSRSFSGRLFMKYMGIEPKPIKFFFEEYYAKEIAERDAELSQ